VKAQALSAAIASAIFMTFMLMSPVREVLLLMSTDHILKITMDFIFIVPSHYGKTIVLLWIIQKCSLSLKFDQIILTAHWRFNTSKY
jgi:hypothetical protein